MCMEISQLPFESSFLQKTRTLNSSFIWFNKRGQITMTYNRHATVRSGQHTNQLSDHNEHTAVSPSLRPQRILSPTSAASSKSKWSNSCGTCQTQEPGKQMEVKLQQLATLKAGHWHFSSSESFGSGKISYWKLMDEPERNQPKQRFKQRCCVWLVQAGVGSRSQFSNPETEKKQRLARKKMLTDSHTPGLGPLAGTGPARTAWKKV